MSELVKERSLVQYTEIPQSVVASRTHNPMRKLVDGMKLRPNPEKPLIALSLGVLSLLLLLLVHSNSLFKSVRLWCLMVCVPYSMVLNNIL